MAPSTSPPTTAVAVASVPKRVAAPVRPGRRPTRATDEARVGRVGVAAWAVVVGVALVWGTLAVADAGVAIRAAPVMGHWRGHGGPAVAVAVLVGAALVAAGPALAARAPWRVVPWGAGAAAVGWATVLAATDGWHRVTEPLTTEHEYEPFAAGITDLGGFLAGFTDDLQTFPVHVQGHPPGAVVLAWALDRVGLGGAGWLAAVALAGWGVAVAAALVAARAVAGERAARRAAPAVALLPGAVWAGTSVDALFAGLTAGAAAAAVLAVTRRSTVLAGVAGLAAGTALLFSYGAVVTLAIPVLAGALLIARDRRPLDEQHDAARPAARVVPRRSAAHVSPARFAAGGVLVLDVATAMPSSCVLASDESDSAIHVRHFCGAPLVAWAAAGAAAVLAVAAAAGFWWLDGLRATGAAYWGGIGAQRPAAYLTLVGNPAALALATGPAVAAGLAVTLSRARVAWRPALLPAAALAAVLVANVSQMSRGETERIWLPFVPWLALAAPGDHRGWLAAQVALALVLQTTLDSPW